MRDNSKSGWPGKHGAVQDASSPLHPADLGEEPLAAARPAHLPGGAIVGEEQAAPASAELTIPGSQGSRAPRTPCPASNTVRTKAPRWKFLWRRRK